MLLNCHVVQPLRLDHWFKHVPWGHGDLQTWASKETERNQDFLVNKMLHAICYFRSLPCNPAHFLACYAIADRCCCPVSSGGLCVACVAPMPIEPIVLKAICKGNSMQWGSLHCVIRIADCKRGKQSMFANFSHKWKAWWKEGTWLYAKVRQALPLSVYQIVNLRISKGIYNIILHSQMTPAHPQPMPFVLAKPQFAYTVRRVAIW